MRWTGIVAGHRRLASRPLRSLRRRRHLLWQTWWSAVVVAVHRWQAGGFLLGRHWRKVGIVRGGPLLRGRRQLWWPVWMCRRRRLRWQTGGSVELLWRRVWIGAVGVRRLRWQRRWNRASGWLRSVVHWWRLLCLHRLRTRRHLLAGVRRWRQVSAERRLLLLLRGWLLEWLMGQLLLWRQLLVWWHRLMLLWLLWWLLLILHASRWMVWRVGIQRNTSHLMGQILCEKMHSISSDSSIRRSWAKMHLHSLGCH